MVTGVFITLEGGDGVGKTTQQALLAERLRREGRDYLCTREPWAIRELLLRRDPLDPLAELFLYVADRAEHVSRVVAPVLAAGQVVICDRFTDSTLAYQGYGRGLDLEKIRQLNYWATGGLQPHLTLWLDLPPEVGLARIEDRDSLERERLEFHCRVYQGFQSLAAAEPQRIVRIDAKGSPAEVTARIWTVVERQCQITKPPAVKATVKDSNSSQNQLPPTSPRERPA